jgi:uncharacterized membrane protein
MNRLFNAAVWVLFAAVVYMICAEAVTPWIELPWPGNIGFTLIFVSFVVVHCGRCEGWTRTGLFFAASAVVSFILEETGVRSGMIFGPYHYGDQLGPMLGHVPLVVPLGWFMMIYPSWLTGRALLRGVDMRRAAGIAALALIAATVMTAWDTVMDPGMAAGGAWVWEQGGSYFGVPLHNYFGWMLTTVLVYVAAGVIWRMTASDGAERLTLRRGISRTFAALPIVVYALHALRYVMAPSLPELHVVAFFAMGLPAMLALMRVWMVDGSAAES